MEPMRELALMIKDAKSIPIALADLSDALIMEMKPALIELSTLANVRSIGDLRKEITRLVDNAAETWEQILDLGAEGADDSSAPPSRLLGRTAHPGNNPFQNPKNHFNFFSKIPVGSLRLSAHTMSRLAKERQRVRQFTRLDYETRRDNVVKLAAQFSNAIGIGSSTYNEVYGITPPTTPRVTTPTDKDYEAAYAMNALIVEMNRLVITSSTGADPKLDSIATVAGLAARSGIAFRIPVSKFAIPFSYGSTLEMIAARHLRDPNRWYEIAALNGLQAPYVDEEGFRLPMLVSGAGNTVLVGDRTNLFVGQPVWLESVGTLREARHITAIDSLSPTQILVTVDGEADLDKYTTMSNAFLQAFLPNTVNSQMVIYIPSERTPKEEDFRSKTIPGLDEFDHLIAVGGIDLLLSTNNDLIITPNGDVRWSVGLTNIIQKIRLALSVRQGTLLEHPEYGLPLAVGDSIADIDATSILRAAQDLFHGDPTFVGVKGARIDINGPMAKLGLAVEVAGFSQIIPVSAEVGQ
jgi:hypothetical protein